jgi:nucleoside permease NupC
MSIVRSILALSSASFAVLAAYAFGHGISNHEPMPFVVSAVSLAIAALLVFTQIRMPDREPKSHHTH